MTAQLTIFADSLCPLCMGEMAHLARLDTKGLLAFVDIHDKDKLKAYDDINSDQANRVLHGKLASGRVLKGLDVTHKAWQLVGKGYLTSVIRFPVIGLIADKVYLVLAKHRYRISYYLTGKSRCDAFCDLSDNDKGIYTDVFLRNLH